MPNTVVKAYAWMMSLGSGGLYEVAKVATLNNVYLTHKMLQHPGVKLPFGQDIQRVEQTRYTIEDWSNKTGYEFTDLMQRVMDFGMHIWSSHHPHYVPQPITLEPTESPSKEDLDQYVATLHHILNEFKDNPDVIDSAPNTSTIHRVDESSLDDPNKWCPTWRVYQNLIREND